MMEDRLAALLVPALGADAPRAVACMELPDLPQVGPGRTAAAELAVALSVALHHGLLARVPTGAAYVADSLAGGRRIRLDHGALRTIRMPGDAPTGALPPGADAFARILEPLGYRRVGVYPLDRLRMTGFAWCHDENPEGIAQYFVSELHVERFGGDFWDIAGRVFGSTRDPLDDAVRAALARLGARGWLPSDEAADMLPALVSAFGCHHDAPALADYEALKHESDEAAWIATEGNAFNHGTDRVEDIDTLVQSQRKAGRAMKDRIEISGSGRVRQTATRADLVERTFRAEDGSEIRRAVPGSFYEFISRDIDPGTGRLDLRFDSANAQGIFRMTALDA